MLHHILNASRKSVLSLTAVALLASLLAACGGGGSGGGGSPAPQKLKIIAPTTAVVNSDDQVIIEFIDAVDTNAVFKLNDIDITSLFTIDTSSKTAKASVYALQGIMAAQANNSTLKASLTGARTESVSFSLEANPELVIISGDDTYLYGSVKGGTGRGYCTDFDPADVLACVGKAGNTQVPVPLVDNVNFRVAVRNAPITSLDVIYGNGASMSATNAGGFEKNKLFTVNNLPVTLGNAGYSFQFNGDELLNIALPGEVINNQIAAQVRSMDKNHVISKWVAEALQATLQDLVSEDNPLILMYAAGTSGAPDQACQLVNALRGAQATPQYFACDVELVSITATSGTLAFEVTATITELPATSALEKGWKITFSAKPTSSISAKIRANAYANTGDTTPVGYVQGVATLVNGSGVNGSIPEFTFSVNIGAADGAEVLTWEVPMQLVSGIIEQNALNISQSVVSFLYPQQCFPTCANASAGAIATIARDTVDKAIADIVDKAVYCMQPYTYEGGAFQVGSAEDCGFDTVPDPMQIARVEAEQPLGTSEHYFSVISASVDNADYKAASNLGGFIGFVGSQKIRNDGVHLNALGAKSTSALGKVAAKAIPQVNNSDMALALSSNWFNQILLSAYQSNVVGQVSMSDEVGNLGALGDYLIDAGQGIIKDTDTVTIDVALGAVPSMRFLQDGSELVAHDVKMRVVLSSSCAGTPATCAPLLDGKPYIDLTMDIKARLSPAVEPGKIVSFEKDDLMLYISKASGTKVTVPILGVVFNPDPKEFYGLMLPVVNQLLEEQIDGFFQPLKYEINFDNLCDNSSLSTVLTNFFGTGRSLSLLLKDLLFDNTNALGEVEHVIAYGQVVNTSAVSGVDTPIFQLTMNYGAASSCE